MCVCVCVCVCVYVCVCARARACACVFCVYARARACVAITHAHMHAHMHAQNHAHKHTHSRTNRWVYNSAQSLTGGTTVYASGQVAVQLIKSGKKFSLSEEIRGVLDNLKAVLEESGDC